MLVLREIHGNLSLFPCHTILKSRMCYIVLLLLLSVHFNKHLELRSTPVVNLSLIRGQ